VFLGVFWGLLPERPAPPAGAGCGGPPSSVGGWLVVVGGGGGCHVSSLHTLPVPPVASSYFVRMFFNPPFTKLSHVASVLRECLEMASTQQALSARGSRGLCGPLVLLALVSPSCPSPPPRPSRYSLSIRFALPFRITPFGPPPDVKPIVTS